MLNGAGVVLVLIIGILLGGLKVSTSAVVNTGSLKDQDFRLTEGKVDGDAGAESDGKKDDFFRCCLIYLYSETCPDASEFQMIQS